MKKSQILIIIVLISFAVSVFSGTYDSASSSAASLVVSAAASLHHFVVVAPGSATVNSAFSLSVTAKDVHNNTIKNYKGSVGLSASSGVISPVSTGSSGWSNGVWSSALVTLSAAGSITITASDGGGHTGTVVLVVSAGSLHHFIFNAISDQTAGSSFSITVTAKDMYENTVKSYTGRPSLTYSAGSISPNTMNQFVNGVGSIAVTVTVADFGVTIAAIDGSHTGVSNSFTVSSSSRIHLVISGFPSSITAGVEQIGTVTAKDTFDNTVKSYSGNIRITSTDKAAVLPADVLLTKGVGSIAVTLKTAGSQSLSATDTSDSSIIGSASVQVFPAALHMFALSSSEAVTAGLTFGNVTVTAYDVYNNVKTNYVGQIYFTSSDSTAVLPYTSSSRYSFVSADKGVHTFSGFALKIVPSQTITISDGSLTKVATLTVNSAGLDHFIFSTVGSQTANSAFNITVTAKDAYNNTASGYVGTPSLSYSAGSVTPARMNAFVNGVGSTSVTLLNSGSGATLIVSDDTHTGTSNSFNVATAPTPTPSPISTPRPTVSQSTPRPTSPPNPTARPSSSPSTGPSLVPSPTTLASPSESTSEDMSPVVVYYEVAVVLVAAVLIGVFAVSVALKSPYKLFKPRYSD